MTEILRLHRNEVKGKVTRYRKKLPRNLNALDGETYGDTLSAMLTTAGRIGHNFKRLLVLTNRTQKEVAALVNKRPATISHIATGKGTTSIDTLDKIARVLGVDISELFAPVTQPDTMIRVESRQAIGRADAPPPPAAETQHSLTQLITLVTEGQREITALRLLLADTQRQLAVIPTRQTGPDRVLDRPKTDRRLSRKKE